MQVRGARGAVATLALKLPKGGVASVADVARLAGAACEVLTYDVIAQEVGPRMSMSEWCAGLLSCRDRVCLPHDARSESP
jgi:hypothetical protein